MFILASTHVCVYVNMCSGTFLEILVSTLYYIKLYLHLNVHLHQSRYNGTRIKRFSEIQAV
jgi:hypothetical protein